MNPEREYIFFCDESDRKGPFFSTVSGGVRVPASQLNPVNATLLDMGNRFRMLVNEVDVVTPGAALPNLPVARAVWVPRPDLKTAAASWILAGGAHHTGFSQAVTAAHLEDFAEIAGLEFLQINADTQVSAFKKELRWNEVYYHLANGF